MYFVTSADASHQILLSQKYLFSWCSWTVIETWQNNQWNENGTIVQDVILALNDKLFLDLVIEFNRTAL
jgi:hypothetical protein